MEAGRVVLADGVEPRREPFTLALGEHPGEGQDVTGEGAEFGAIGQDGLEPDLFHLGRNLGPAENPARHPPGDGGCAVTGRGGMRFSRG